MTQLLLGVDGGGSKTEAILAVVAERAAAANDTEQAQSQPRWQRIGRGLADGCNVSREIQVDPIKAAILAAFEDAGLAPQSVTAACFALAGCGAPRVAQRAQDAICTAGLAERFSIVHDAQPLLAHVPWRQPGIALIAGTGSLAWGRWRYKDLRAGGWGPLLGDEGSGYWTALEAFKAIALAHDQRAPATVLQETVLQQLGANTPRDMPAIIAASERKQLARVAPLVFDAARRGDQVAQRIVHEALGHLSDLVTHVAQQLNVQDEPVSLAVAGGLLVNQSECCDGLRKMLGDRSVIVRDLVPITNPAAGAVELAFQLAQKPDDE